MGDIEWGEAYTLSNFTRVIAAVIWLDARSLNANDEANHEIGRRASERSSSFPVT